MFRIFIAGILLILMTGTPASGQYAIGVLDRYFEQALHDWEIPGFAVGIVKDGQVLLTKGYGVLEQGKREQVDGNTVFAIASNTKAFISAAIAMLVEEGKLSWDDPVQKYLPYFALYDDYASAHTTVRDLLCHRAGLGTFSGDVIWYKSNYTAEEVVRRAREVPRAYDFRAGYGYSNLMFIAAGEVIRAVSGQPWDAFLKARIFTPLGMERTQTSVTDLEKMKNVASPHKPSEGGNQPIPYANWDNMGAAGGILSSVSDMARWLQLQIDGGTFEGRQLFKPESQTTFWTFHNNYRVSAGAREIWPSRHFAGYGLGWGIFDYGGRMVVNHGGGYDGMYSQVCVVPEEKLGIVVLTNSMKGISPALMYYVLDQFLGVEGKDWSRFYLDREKKNEADRRQRIQERRDKRQANTKPSLPLAQYAGTYHCKMYGDVIVEAGREDQLRLLFPSAPALNATLRHWHFDTFEIVWDETHAWFDFGTVQFILDNNGQPQELQFDVPNDDIFFEEIQARR